MKRKIIEINEELCTGCGDCVIGCAEGALQIVDGKAKVVKEEFCDGFGDCIGTCPTGALKIVERDAKSYNVEATREHVLKTGGKEALKRFDKANKEHDEKTKKSIPMGCPGLKVRMASATEASTPVPTTGKLITEQVIRSDLTQWPVQLHLVQPTSPFFDGKELVILSTCSPVASPDVHWRFVRGRSVVVACPKLDKTEGYIEKLAGIFAQNNIPKILIIRMTVPCCGGLSMIVRKANNLSGKTNLIIEEVTIDINGDFVKSEMLIK